MHRIGIHAPDGSGIILPHNWTYTVTSGKGLTLYVGFGILGEFHVGDPDRITGETVERLAAFLTERGEEFERVPPRVQ